MALAPDGHQDRPIRIELPTVAALNATNLIEVKVVGDAYNRAVLKADGTILKGNGTVAPV